MFFKYNVAWSKEQIVDDGLPDELYRAREKLFSVINNTDENHPLRPSAEKLLERIEAAKESLED